MSRSDDGDTNVVGEDEMLCDEVETVRQFTYLDDMVSIGG